MKTTQVDKQALLRITRADIQHTHTRLICGWCDALCDIIDCQCDLTYGSRHGFEGKRK